MRVRPFTPRDVPSVLAIQATAGIGDGWNEANYLNLASSGGFVAVAEEGEPLHLLGFVALRRAFDEAEILSLAVDAPYRRRGTGRALVRSACEWMRREGIAAAWLEVRASNLAAIRLYSSTGFRFHSARKWYYRNPDEDADIMRLQVLSFEWVRSS
jgi:[ribosomal protein S18]-alanine N-acetyltransferase